MKLLLDTHILIWVLTGDARLSAKAVEMIQDVSNEKYFSAISVWEVSIKRAKRPGNIHFTAGAFAQACRDAGFKPIPIYDWYVPALESLSRAADAPRHMDPFDRMLIAQAKAEGMRFLTHDTLLSGYQEPCVVLI